MDINDYLITEFSGDILTFRRPDNEFLSRSEVKFLKEELYPFGKFNLLFSGTNTSRVQIVLCKIFDKDFFSSSIAKQVKKIYEVDNKKFVLCGYNFDSEKAEHTLTFYAKNYDGFSDEDMTFFAVEMHKFGATSVYNWHDDISKLNHRLNFGFKHLNYNFVMCPIRKLTCTFKDDENGRKAVKLLFDKYSVFPEKLEDECYEDCVITAFKKDGNFTLLNNSNYLSRFSTDELSKICNWLYSLGATRIAPICYREDSTLLCNDIECSFGPNIDWQQKLNAFIRYNEKSYITTLQKLGVILPEANEYSPNWNLQVPTKGIHFTLLKGDKLSRRERFYFLMKLLSFGPSEILAKNHTIYCEFSDDETGRKLRCDAILSLIE